MRDVLNKSLIDLEKENLINFEKVTSFKYSDTAVLFCKELIKYVGSTTLKVSEIYLDYEVANILNHDMTLIDFINKHV